MHLKASHHLIAVIMTHTKVGGSKKSYNILVSTVPDAIFEKRWLLFKKKEVQMQLKKLFTKKI